MAALRITVVGQVQGVGFRAWTVIEARRLGLCGSVRNRLDGSVEVHVAGDPALLDRFVQSLKVGPRAARVSGVNAVPADDPGVAGFVQAPTA
jgi:acylphosphatase